MEPRDAAWNRVSEQFAALGESLRRHYQEEGAEPTEATKETRESVEEALRTLADAADRLATTAGKAMRDPEVQAEAKGAASSLVDALGVTFSSLSGQVRERFEQRGQEQEWEERRPSMPPDPSITPGQTPASDTPPPNGEAPPT